MNALEEQKILTRKEWLHRKMKGRNGSQSLPDGNLQIAEMMLWPIPDALKDQAQDALNTLTMKYRVAAQISICRSLAPNASRQTALYVANPDNIALLRAVLHMASPKSWRPDIIRLDAGYVIPAQDIYIDGFSKAQINHMQTLLNDQGLSSISHKCAGERFDFPHKMIRVLRVMGIRSIQNLAATIPTLAGINNAHSHINPRYQLI